MVALRDTGLVDLTDGCERISQLKSATMRQDCNKGKNLATWQRRES